jgi:YVTN family beta-propeller protein
VRTHRLAFERGTAVLFGLLVGIGAPTATLRAQAGQQLVFVENTNSGDISIIDNATLKVVGTIAVGLSPDDIIASPDEKTLYVSRIVRTDAGRPTGQGEVVAVDPATRQVLWRAQFRGLPNHLATSPDGSRIYATIVSTNQVFIVDPTKHAVVDSIEVGIGPHDIVVTPDGRRLYVGLIRGNELTIADATNHHILHQTAFRSGVRPLALTPDARQLFVQLSYLHGFVVVDPATGDTLRRVHLPFRQGQTAPDSMPNTADHGIRVTADGRYLLANGSMSNLVAIYSLPGLSLVGTAPVGTDPNWIALTPDGKRAYISNRGSDDVSVIDLTTRKEIARIKVGKYPERLTALRAAAP